MDCCPSKPHTPDVQKLLILGFVSALAAAGSTIQFTGLPINTEFGTFNGFALATVDGSPDQLLICDDFNHTTYVPSGPLMYDASTLGAADPLQYVRFPGGQAMALYEQAALLLDGLQHTGNGQLLDLTADYQYALWHLFTPSVALPTATARTLLQDTAAAVAQGNPRQPGGVFPAAGLHTGRAVRQQPGISAVTRLAAACRQAGGSVPGGAGSGAILRDPDRRRLRLAGDRTGRAPDAPPAAAGV